jgi:hypothetical protein
MTWTIITDAGSWGQFAYPFYAIASESNAPLLTESGEELVDNALFNRWVSQTDSATDWSVQ